VGTKKQTEQKRPKSFTEIAKTIAGEAFLPCKKTQRGAYYIKCGGKTICGAVTREIGIDVNIDAIAEPRTNTVVTQLRQLLSGDLTQIVIRTGPSTAKRTTTIWTVSEV